MKKFLWYAGPYIVLPILLVEVPITEIRRVWRFMRIRKSLMENLKRWNDQRAMPFPQDANQ